jgi:hypothetical protein
MLYNIEKVILKGMVKKVDGIHPNAKAVGLSAFLP